MIHFDSFQVLGNKGGITLINVTKATFETSPKLNISGVQISFITEDDKVILNTGSFILRDVEKKLQFHECYLHTSEEILPATWKADLFGEEWHILASPNEDIFSAGEEGVKGNFNRVAKRLFDSQ